MIVASAPWCLSLQGLWLCYSSTSKPACYQPWAPCPEEYFLVLPRKAKRLEAALKTKEWDPPGRRISASRLPHQHSPGSPVCLPRPEHSGLYLFPLFYFLNSTYEWNHMLSSLTCFASIILSRSIHVITNGKISFFLWLNNIPPYI